MLIDQCLPMFDVTHVSETAVAAPTDQTYRAIRETDLRDPLVDALFLLRELPQRIARRLRGKPPAVRGKLTFADVAESGAGWVTIAENPGTEFVVGSVGRVWERKYGGRRVGAEEFITFSEPGYAKIALSVSVRPWGEGTLLRYEARTQTTDEVARRNFGRYWRVIHGGVALVMHRVLSRIKAEAERRARRAAAVIV